jgi:hypothetical protein
MPKEKMEMFFSDISALYTSMCSSIHNITELFLLYLTFTRSSISMIHMFLFVWVGWGGGGVNLPFCFLNIVCSVLLWLLQVRHPNILSFLHSTEAEAADGPAMKYTIYIVTEPVMPLSEKLKELNLGGTQRYHRTCSFVFRKYSFQKETICSF